LVGWFFFNLNRKYFMGSTQIRGLQLRLATLPRDRIDPAFEASLAAIEANVTSIFNTMSTDTERMAAIEALTTAFEGADTTLQGAITGLINATKAGAGLEADGSLVLPVGHNYLTGATSIKAAVGLLDAALKTEADARVAADAALTTSINDLIAAGASDTTAAIAAEAALRVSGDATNAAAISAETTRATNAEAANALAISNEVTARTLLNTTLSDAIAAEATARTTAINGEASARSSADTVLQNALDAEALARTTADGTHTTAIASEVSRATAAEGAEATARAAGDAALDTRVVALEGAVASTLNYGDYIPRETPVGTVDGTNAEFVLAFLPHLGSETVFLNGMMLEPGVGNDYTITDSTITLAAAPLTGDRVRVTYFR
jgi:hypothetical protein